jgi:RNA polymerase sigma-70 factor, ECF subfamily
VDSDTELILAVKAGNEEAFNKLYRKYYPKVLNVAFRFIPDQKHAEDIAQEVFLRVYYGAKTFSPQAKFSTWLYRITSNRCFSRYRQFRKEKHLCINEADMPLSSNQNDGALIDHHPAPTPSPADQLLQHELSQTVQTALEQLSSDQRMALVLLEYAGLTYQEIAQASGCTVKAVERRIYHARKRLRELLGPYLAS